jgi:hypothetical protein
MEEEMTLDGIYARTVEVPWSGCWIWQRATDSKGYGACFHEGKVQKAHRVSVKLSSGRDIDGMVVCHTCDIPSCVNPDHLFVGTQKDNMMDASEKGRTKACGTNSPHGQMSNLSKLTDDCVRLIRSMDITSPAERLSLAKHFGVNERTIRDIVSLRSWKRVK